MKRKLLVFCTSIIFMISLSGIGYADAVSPYAFSYEAGKRLIWDNESNSGLLYPAGFAFDQAYLPVGLGIYSSDLRVELIPQSFPEQKETFRNFTYYSISRFHDTTELLNLATETTIRNDLSIYRVSYERDPLMHETTPYRYHSLFFIERGAYQGDLLILRSKAPMSTDQALAYYRNGPLLQGALSSPSDRVRSPISSPSPPLFSAANQPLTEEKMTIEDLSQQSLVWGIFDPSAPGHLAHVQHLEKELDTEFNLILRYTSFDDSFNQLKLDMANAREDQRLVELTLQTNEGNGLDSSIYAVLNGLYDEDLRLLAHLVRAQEDPVLFRLNNEMNGDWCNYSALHYGLETQLYRDVWAWIYQIFQEEGADNARWVFNPNERSFPKYRWNHMLAYLPNPNQIDAVGLTGYNTGTYYKGETWRSFSEIYQPIYQEYTQVFDYPLLITEFASSSIGGDKTAWIQDMFVSLKDFPRLEGLVWWNYADYDSKGQLARPYYIDETPEVMDAFRAGMNEQNNKK